MAFYNQGRKSLDNKLKSVSSVGTTQRNNLKQRMLKKLHFMFFLFRDD